MILKPAPETPRTAWWLARQLWRAGIPDDVVQFARSTTVRSAPTSSPTTTSTRSCSPAPTTPRARFHRVEARTGDCSPRRVARTRWSSPPPPTSTGRSPISSVRRSGTPVRSARRRAWRSSRRPCTTTPEFTERLRAAVESLVVGPGADPATMMGPLIRPPEGPLARALTSLDAGERWLVEPRSSRRRGHHLESRRAPRRAARVVVPPDRVLRAGARRDAGRRSRRRRSTCRTTSPTDSPAASRASIPARSTGGSSGSRSATPTSTATSPGRSCAPAVRRVEALVGRPRAPRPAGRATCRCSAGSADLRARPSTTRGRVVPPLVDDLVRRRARPIGTRIASATPCATARSRRVLLRHGHGDRRRRARAGPSRRRRCAASPLRAFVVADESDDELAARLRSVDDAAPSTGCGCSYRRVDALLAACHRADIAVDAEPVSPHGRVELAHWVREQAISETAHRHGRPLLSTAVDRLRDRHG